MVTPDHGMPARIGPSCTPEGGPANAPDLHAGHEHARRPGPDAPRLPPPVKPDRRGRTGDQLGRPLRAPRPNSTGRMSLHVGLNGNTTGCTTGTTTSKAPSRCPMPKRASTPPVPDSAHPIPGGPHLRMERHRQPQVCSSPVVHLSPADAEDHAVRRPGLRRDVSQPRRCHTGVRTPRPRWGAGPTAHPRVDGPIRQAADERPPPAPTIPQTTPFIRGERCPFKSTDKPVVRLCPFPLRPRRHEAYLRAPCGRGGIGRHARFRIWCRKAWGFESLRPHTATLTRATTWKSHRKRSTTSMGS